MAGTKGFIQSVSAKIFDLNRKNTILAFRIISLILVVYLTLNNQNIPLSTDLFRSATFQWLFGISALHLASSVLIFFGPDWLVKKGFLVSIFVIDIVLISLVIVLTQGFESDLFLIVFLVMYMTLISRYRWASFMVAAMGCLLYGFLFLKTHPVEDLLQSSVVIRFPLFLLVAFFSYIVMRDIELEREDLKASEKELRHLSEELQTAVAVKSRSAFTVSHDLNLILELAF